MTLREKVGQLFVPYVYGASAGAPDPADVEANRQRYGVDNAEQMIARYHVGGIIYFTWAHNLRGATQTARLSNGIQHAAMRQRVPVPMLISTDQEQGIVHRLPPGATLFPGNMALGAAREPSYAQTSAAVTAQELRAVGINQNFAPDADVNIDPANPIIGVRSFGSSSALVASLTRAAVTGYQRAGVAATAKHFPGHGDTSVDSHVGLPVITHTRSQLEAIDLPPFKAAIGAGVDAIMSAHIVVPALDASRRPATLSRPILTELLRRQLGYEGVIITDSLEMAGVRQMFPDDRVPVEAIKAGADMMLMPPNLPAAIDGVVRAVRSGEISQPHLDRSVYRILELKSRRGLFTSPYVSVSGAKGSVGSLKHWRTARAITDRTVTLIKNGAALLPLAASSHQRVLVVGADTETAQTLARYVALEGASAHYLSTGTDPAKSQVDYAVRSASGFDVVVAVTIDAASHPGQQELVRSLIAAHRQVVVASTGNPYDIAYFTGAQTYLVTYNYTSVSLWSLARVLFGQVDPMGKLPVMIPVAGDPDRVLYRFGYGLRYGSQRGR